MCMPKIGGPHFICYIQIILQIMLGNFQEIAKDSPKIGRLLHEGRDVFEI